MNAKSSLLRRPPSALAVAMALTALPAARRAEPQASAPAAPAPAPLDVRPLGPGAWVLVGDAGNVVIVPAADGALIVDDERARDVPAILEAVHRFTPGPVRIVINSHRHLDHSGGNPALARTGAVIAAQREVRTRRAVEQFMPAYNSHIPPAAPADLPQVVFDDRLELHFSDETLHLVHAPNAHTDGDAIVWLEKANAVHMGDVYFNGIWPFIDRASGGSMQGEIATKAQLKAYRDMLVEVQAKVKAGIKAKKTLAEIVASKPALAYEKGMEGREQVFVEAIYDSLVKPR